MDLKKVSAISMIGIVVLNFVFLVFGKVSLSLFWLITVVAAVFAFFVLPKF